MKFKNSWNTDYETGRVGLKNPADRKWQKLIRRTILEKPEVDKKTGRVLYGTGTKKKKETTHQV